MSTKYWTTYWLCIGISIFDKSSYWFSGTQPSIAPMGYVGLLAHKPNKNTLF
jgi:hypothetical protein